MAGGLPRDAMPSLPKREVQAWLAAPPDRFTLSQHGDFITALPAPLGEPVSALGKALRVVQRGITVAEVKGKDCIPHHALALSTALNAEAFPGVELDLHHALRYLKKETFASPSQSKGFELVRYKGLPLGFVKNLGSRCNNLFPQEWRIRMSLEAAGGNP
jgi:NOL1/NOP2/fmu family ribosome biogenesis protein